MREEEKDEDWYQNQDRKRKEESSIEKMLIIRNQFGFQPYLLILGVMALMLGVGGLLFIGDSVSLSCRAERCEWETTHMLGLASDPVEFFGTSDILVDSIIVDYHARASGYKSQHRCCFSVRDPAGLEKRYCFPFSSFWYPETDSSDKVTRIRAHIRDSMREGVTLLIHEDAMKFSHGVFCSAFVLIGIVMLCISTEFVTIDFEAQRIRFTARRWFLETHRDYEIGTWDSIYWKSVSSARARYPRYQIIFQSTGEFLPIPILYASDRLAHRKTMQIIRFFEKNGKKLAYRNETEAHVD